LQHKKLYIGLKFKALANQINFLFIKYSFIDIFPGQHFIVLNWQTGITKNKKSSG
jgi:hypothetical protein